MTHRARDLLKELNFKQMSRPTATLQGEKAREAILRGVNSVYRPVSATLGPQGKNALLFRTWNRGSRITNDGWTVAECQEPKDQFERLVNNAFKESCRRTNELSGDGTTTTIVIGGALYNLANALFSKNEGYSQKGVSVTDLRKRLLESARKVKEAIKVTRIKDKIETLEELEKIAVVSVEDVELGKTIAQMAWRVGVDGFIDVIEGFKGVIETEVIEGFRFPAKVPSKAFVTHPAKFEMIAEGCAILITNYDLDSRALVDSFLGPLIDNEKVTKIVILAPSFGANVLERILKTNVKVLPDGRTVPTGFTVLPVHTPSLRIDQYEDLAVYCDGKFFNKEKGQRLVGVKASDLGYIQKLIVKDVEAREDAIATGGRGAIISEQMVEVDKDREVRRGKETKTVKEREKVFKNTSKVAERIEVLKSQLKETQQESFKKLLERRIASMASAMGVIRVGDSTQASSLYKKLKIEDAVNACKAALRSGYVKGGGLCLKEVAKTLAEDDLLRGAIEAPYNQIQASVDGGVEITDDIIDPAEVVLNAVEHAVGVVANLITVDVITVELEDPAPEEGQFAIARALTELVISEKRHKGQITKNEEEMERDRMGGRTVEEMELLDRG